jgi:hypothetical protein
MVAEGVYQTMQGNPVRAGGALTAIAAGEAPPPEPEVVRTARSGVAVTHRLLAAFDADPSRAAVFVRHWPIGPRGQAEPVLNAWAAMLFSAIPQASGWPQPLTGMLNRGTRDPIFSPQQIVFWYRAHGPHGPTEKRTLEGFDLCPLDLLYAQRQELEQRILYHLFRTSGFNTIELVFEDPGEPDVALSPSQISLQSVLEIARAARSLISNARALAPDDVAWPEQPEGRVDESELGKRLQQARTGLETALGKLRDSLPVETGETGSLPPVAGQLPRGDLKDIRSALLALAAFGVQGAIPAPPTGNAQQDGKALHLQAEQVAAQAQERLAASKDPDLTIAGRIEALFGGGFRVLPVFQPDEDLEAAVAERTRIGDATPDVVIPWLQQMALLRPAAARLETVQMYTYANDRRGIGSVRVAQLPLPDKVQPDEPLPDGVQPKEPWVALRPRAKSSIPGGRLSMAIYQPLGNVQLGEDKKVAGLMIDQWVEVVPNKEETTAVAFHYDAPAARPPQSILLAVPPRAGLQWSLDILEKTLLETLELAKLRTVDLHSLPSVGHFLPALFMASNQGVADETENPGHDPHGDTISTNFVVKADGKSIWHQ